MADVKNIDLGQKTLPLGQFVFGPLDIAANEQACVLNMQKVLWLDAKDTAFTYQPQYSTDGGKTWISFNGLQTVTDKKIPAKFGNPEDNLRISFTVPEFGVIRQVRLLIDCKKVCVMTMKMDTKQTKVAAVQGVGKVG
jgi:hypothetical protein